MEGAVAIAFENTVSNDPAVVKQATLDLEAHSKSIDFIKICMDIIASSNSIKQNLPASIFLKNLVRKQWELPEYVEWRTVVRSAILPLCFRPNLPKAVSAQVMEIIFVVAKLDFPVEWPDLLNNMVTSYLSPYSVDSSPAINLMEVSKAATIADVALTPYRTAIRSELILGQLLGILQQSQTALLGSFLQSVKMYAHACLSQTRQPGSGSTSNILEHGEICLHTLSCIVSLHGVDLPEFFENNLGQLIEAICALLRLPIIPDVYASNEEGVSESSPTLSLRIKTVACLFLKFYGTKYEEEFERYVPKTLEAVVQCIDSEVVAQNNVAADGSGNVFEDASADEFIATATNFIATVAKVKWDPEITQVVEIFGGPALEKICNLLIIPNLGMRKFDIENLQEAPLEFTRLEIEGAEKGDRREACLTLVKNLMIGCGEDKIIAFLKEKAMAKMCALTATPTTGEDKLKKAIQEEAVANLVVAMAVKTSMRKRGVLETTGKIPVQTFFEQQLEGGLVASCGQKSSAENLATEISILNALKFSTTFRNQFSMDYQTNKLLPVLVSQLTSPSVVIRTYAAYSLERLLAARVYLRNGSFKPGQSPTELIVMHKVEPRILLNDTMNEALLKTIDTLLNFCSKFTASGGNNEFLMRCVLRLILTAQIPTASLTSMENQAVEILKQASINLSNPAFLHEVFELMALLTQMCCKAQLGGVELQSYVLETCLPILQNEEHDYAQYTYQLLAILMGVTNPPALHEKDKENSLDKTPALQSTVLSLYSQLFDFLLQHDRYTVRASNIPGILAVLTAYIKNYRSYGGALVTENVVKLLDRFQYCLVHKSVPLKDTFDLLLSMLIYLPWENLQGYTKDLVSLLLDRCRNNLQMDALKSLSCLSIAVIAIRTAASGNSLFAAIEQIQAGLAGSFLDSLFVPTACKATSTQEKLLFVEGLALFYSEPGCTQREHVGAAIIQMISGTSSASNWAETIRIEEEARKGESNNIKEVMAEAFWNAESYETSMSANRLSYVRLKPSPLANAPNNIISMELVKRLLEQALVASPDERLAASCKSVI